MKKLLSTLLITFMLVPAATAFAEETVKPTAENAKKVEVKAKKQSEKEAKTALVNKLRVQKQELQKLQERNQALREEIKTKREQIKPVLAVLRKDKNNPEAKAKLEQVKAKLQSLQPDTAVLKSLKDAGKPYWEQYKTNVKTKNIEVALSNLESIANIRDSRYEALSRINKTLDEVLKILK